MSARTNEVVDLPLFQAAQTYLRDFTHNRGSAAEARAAWDHLYRLCDQAIRRFATAFGARSADLEDCCQEAWAELVPLLARFNFDPSRGDFSTWLYTIVRSATVNFLRRRSQQQTICRKVADLAPPAPEPSGSSEPAQLDVTIGTLLHRAKKCLSPVNYRLMCLRWIEGQTVAHTAQELGLTREQVWYHEHRIRKSLRRALVDLNPGGQSIAEAGVAMTR